MAALVDKENTPNSHYHTQPKKKGKKIYIVWYTIIYQHQQQQYSNFTFTLIYLLLSLIYLLLSLTYHQSN